MNRCEKCNKPATVRVTFSDRSEHHFCEEHGAADVPAHARPTDWRKIAVDSEAAMEEVKKQRAEWEARVERRHQELLLSQEAILTELRKCAELLTRLVEKTDNDLE